jgi:hypothetical protein
MTSWSRESCTQDEKHLIETIEENCKVLASGYSERVEYKVPVIYHRAQCSDRGHCECPTTNETRVRSVVRPCLLDQLQEFQENKDTNRNPQAARGAPRVKTPKMHPELRGFFVLDEITCEAYMLLDRVFEEGGRDRVWLAQKLKYVIQNLTYQMTCIVEARPDLVGQVMRATNKWVGQARGALNQNVSDAMFGDTVCGNCGGGLSVAWDNSSDVRCVGTPSAPPCGETYPMDEWVSLYERGKR